jgi:multiple sugar transport system substrate-binding protein
MRNLLLISLALGFSCTGQNRSPNTLHFWQFWSDMNTKPVIEQLVAEFEAENPGVDVKITDLTWANGHEKLVISFAAKQPPDVMELGSDWVAEFAASGLLAPLESDLPENYLFPAMWNDNLYSLPWMLDTRILYFNVDLLEKVGIGVPKTWDELAEACARIDRLGDQYFGFGCNSAERHRLYKKFLPFLWSNGGQVLDDAGKTARLDSPEAIRSLEYYLGLCDCGLIESQRRLEEFFREGRIGFVISGGWLLRRLMLTPPPFKYRLIEFFSPTGDMGISFFGGEYLAVYKETPNLAAAERLISFLTRRENSQRLCEAAGFGFPPYENLAVADSEVAAEINQLRHSISNPPTPLWVDIEQDIEDAIEAAMFKHGTASEILISANKAINAKLESYRSAQAE